MRRYDAMRDSGIVWIGEIPSHWRFLRMKNIFRNVSEKNHPDAEVLSLYREYGVLPKNSRDDNHNVTSEDTGSYKFVRVSDLVINKMKAWQGSLAISGYEGIISPAYYVCHFITDDVSKRYYHYLLRSKNYAQEFERLSTGMRVGQWDLGIDDFMSIPALVPPLSEQESIARYLDEQLSYIDSAVEEARNSIEDYKKWKFSMIYEAVTKGLDSGNEMRSSGIRWIGELPSSWAIRALFQLVTQVKNKNVDLSEKNLLSLSYGKIKRKSIDTTDGLLPASFDGYNIIEANDIVLRLTDLQNDHTSLRVGRATERGIITSAYVTIRPMEGVNSEYLYYVLHAFDLKKGLYGMGSGVRQGLNYDEVKMIKIPYAPEHIQSQIVAYLDEQCKTIESIIEEKQALISDLEFYKRSLIYEVVTGKRKVV